MYTRDRAAKSYLAAMPRGTAFAQLISTKQKDESGWRRTCIRITALHIGILLFLGMLLCIDANAQQEERQDFGSNGLFSYIPPAGWQVSDFSGTKSKGAKFKVSHGAPTDGTELYIVVLDETYTGSLDDYVRASIPVLQKKYGSQALGQTEFMTSDGTRAVKLLTERVVSEKKHCQIFYIFDAGKKKLVAGCVGLAERAPELDKVCDECMKTFRVAPAPK
jgi:hypothetical protein